MPTLSTGISTFLPPAKSYVITSVKFRTKIEALTASLAEKNANIALIETSGSTNASTQQAVSKLQTERDQLQKQLRQLSFARDALTEQRKMR
ncbi:ethionine resistance protein [Sparganum proliferum]